MRSCALNGWIPDPWRQRLDRRLAQHCSGLTVPLSWSQGVVSMTFDDAPISAFERGGDEVREAGGYATYYCSLGLLNQPSPCGLLASPTHLQNAWSVGHELGCHTFDHLDAWSCDVPTFLASVSHNARAFSALIPGFRPRTFAYPKQGPRWVLKRRLSDQFWACRGGCSDTHTRSVDLRMLRCVFLDRGRRPPDCVLHDLIDRTMREPGWLILATHDVSTQPSVYGCHTRDLRHWLRCCTSAGLRLLTVEQACRELRDGGGAGGRN